MVWDGEPLRSYMAHYDMSVKFPLLNIRVTFLWRPVDNGNIGKVLKFWALNPSRVPVFILLGKS